MDPIYSFGEWLQKRRKALDLTREELSRCSGCSVSALRKIEADERRPSKQLSGLLADCLKIPLDERTSFLKIARGELAPDRFSQPALVPALEFTSTDITTVSRNNLPVPMTPLVGREAELAALEQLLQDPGCRLVTLVGPGGIGKTRLAIQEAIDQQVNYPDGVFFVSLVGVSGAEFIVPAMAEALKFSFHGALDPKTQLLNYLREKKMLFVLDNFEHLVEGAGLVTEILEKAQFIRLLVTSREQLNIRGEWSFGVDGLSYPPPASDDRLEDPQKEAGVLLFENYPAVALFVQAARRAQVGFALAAGDHQAVAQIGRWVDGMPLGIELAASWIRTLTCPEIAQEMERSLDFLAVPGRGRTDRQHSIRAVFEASWEMLNEEEQRVAGQLSVFRGGFTRQAAEQVAGATLAVLSALIAKSFLRRQSTGRYDMHDLLRQYTALKASGSPEELASCEERHGFYYLDLVRRLESPLKGKGQAEAQAEMSTEMDNIRAAWRYAVLHHQVDLIRLSLQGFWAFYDARNWFHEALSNMVWAAAALEKAHGSGFPMEGPHAILFEYLLAFKGWFSMHTGKLQEALLLIERSSARLRALHAQTELTFVLHYLGIVYWQAGEYAKSRAALEERLELDKQSGIAWNLGITYGNLGILDQTEGRYQEALQDLEQSLSILEPLGDFRMTAIGFFFLGGAESALGKYEQAQAHLHKSIEMTRAIGDYWATALGLNYLGSVYMGQSRFPDAQRLFRESLDWSREAGENWAMLQSLVNLGFATCALGDCTEAEARFMEALRLSFDTHLVPFTVDTLAGLALVQEKQGSAGIALEWAIQVMNHPAVSQESRARAGKLRNELEHQLSPAQIEAACQRANTIPFEKLVEGILAGYLTSSDSTRLSRA
ncbi:MAG: tetratricopeptide repeat protein [Omnitrophica WOR_2 bacterium]